MRFAAVRSRNRTGSRSTRYRHGFAFVRVRRNGTPCLDMVAHSGRTTPPEYPVRPDAEQGYQPTPDRTNRGKPTDTIGPTLKAHTRNWRRAHTRRLHAT